MALGTSRIAVHVSSVAIRAHVTIAIRRKTHGSPVIMVWSGIVRSREIAPDGLVLLRLKLVEVVADIGH